MGDPYLRFAKSDGVFDWLSVCVRAHGRQDPSS